MAVRLNAKVCVSSIYLWSEILCYRFHKRTFSHQNGFVNDDTGRICYQEPHHTQYIESSQNHTYGLSGCAESGLQNSTLTHDIYCIEIALD